MTFKENILKVLLEDPYSHLDIIEIRDRLWRSIGSRPSFDKIEAGLAELVTDGYARAITGSGHTTWITSGKARLEARDRSRR
jgi:hypothetical protein